MKFNRVKKSIASHLYDFGIKLFSAGKVKTAERYMSIVLVLDNVFDLSCEKERLQQQMMNRPANMSFQVVDTDIIVSVYDGEMYGKDGQHIGPYSEYALNEYIHNEALKLEETKRKL